MTDKKPMFTLSPDSRFNSTIGPKWSIVPLRIPTGWAIRWNTIEARKLTSGEFEFNDSEDLFWAVKLPPPDNQPYSTDPTSPWRKIAIDAGWYRDHFKIVVLDPDWDHVQDVYRTPSVEDFITRLELWLLEVVNVGQVKTKNRLDKPST
jgi:hypothetical protein